MAVVLKYSASVYQEKIDALQTLKNRLEGNLDKLESLKSKIPEFWQDEQASKYIVNISKAIAKVRQAQTDIDGLTRVYQDSVSDLNRGAAAVDEVVDDIGNAIDKTVEVVGKVVPVIAAL